MSPAQAVILGAIQGLTEFFPISSSGHLVLVQEMYGFQESMLTFDIYVHFGTLLAVVTVFYRSLLSLISAFASGAINVLRGRASVREVYMTGAEFRFCVGIMTGSIPAAVLGFTLKDFIEGLFQSAPSVLAAMFVTGAVLLGTFAVKPGERTIGALNGFIVGIAQAVAIIPGISRSGSTISATLFLGVRRETAGEFSFILSIPAVIGASLLVLKDSFEGGSSIIPVHIALIGIGASWAAGWVSLVFLMRLIKKGKIGYFGFYCLAVAAVGAIALIVM